MEISPENIFIKREFLKMLQHLSEIRGVLFIKDIEAEVINFTCIYCILNPDADINIYADFFINITQEHIHEYDKSHANIARLAIHENLEWDGMKSFLINYYYHNHRINILSHFENLNSQKKETCKKMINKMYRTSNRNWKTLMLFNIFLDDYLKKTHTDVFKTLLWNNPFKNFNFTVESFQLECFPDSERENTNLIDNSILIDEYQNNLFELQHFRCGGGLINDLNALSVLPNLKFIDCRESLINDLSPLKDLFRLEKLYITHTNVNSLKPIWHLNIREIRLGSTIISREEIEQYKHDHPNCLINN